ncbi:unnamed protein product [Paramecium octaurelia]|uniref:Uncharacterized protein n=1 Tax=Paramecium octaurelia TaxID=43137 RepID=A0A8S1U4B3_PAROT|nr:unnamed protein product [Paramecium octaurelia]
MIEIQGNFIGELAIILKTLKIVIICCRITKAQGMNHVYYDILDSYVNSVINTIIEEMGHILQVQHIHAEVAIQQLIIHWTIISTLMSVISTAEMIEEFLKGLSLKAFGIGGTIKQTQTAILITVFKNYLQIISTIFTFQLQVPIGIASLVNTVGNTIESLAYSLDCFLVSIKDILIIYFRIIWSLIMTSTYKTVIFCLFGIGIVIKLIKCNFSFISPILRNRFAVF